jgi:hypothetical protein
MTMIDDEEEKREDRLMLKGVRAAQIMLETAPDAIRVYHELLLKLLRMAREDIPGHRQEQRDLRDAIDWVTRS